MNNGSVKEKNSILIVDDDRITLTSLSQILRKDYLIYTASSGELALDIAEKIIPDLIILDIILPGMDGYKVLETLKKTHWGRNIPVLIITILNNADSEVKGLLLGAVDYIDKPVVDIIVKLRVRHQMQIINQMRSIDRLTQIDQLTGIPNRRCFDNRLQLEWSRAVRDGLGISMLFLDLDNLKNYNDTYGHQQGDAVLCSVAQILARFAKRETDLAARWAGDEFVVLLPNTDECGAISIGEKICKDVAEMSINANDAVKVSVSVGVNHYKPTASCSMDAFIFGADQALYTAKKNGRNRVFCLQHDR